MHLAVCFGGCLCGFLVVVLANRLHKPVVGRKNFLGPMEIRLGLSRSSCLSPVTHVDVTMTESSAGFKGGKIGSRFRGFEFSIFFETGSAPADPDLAGFLAGRDVEIDLPLTDRELTGDFADRYW